MGRTILLTVIVLAIIGASFAVWTVFFDEAVLVRKHTFYHADVHDKVVALTFDDGPSRQWTPQILDELRTLNVKATFFMVGEHVNEYPDIARRVAREGHEIGNHSYNHRVLMLRRTRKLENEIMECEAIIKKTTGVKTRFFRPPKAWLTEAEKKKIEGMGYTIVLWSLNSKDWVTIDDKYIVGSLAHRIKPGDILLFHDSGGIFGVEGGDRHETILAVSQLIRRLKAEGYRFVTISELWELNNAHGR